MTLQALQYLIALAEYQNFTRAAEACFVSQPALSRAIRELEEELGCPLFVRTSRHVELTEAGKCCLHEAEHIVRRCRELPEKVRAVARQEEPPLRLGYVIYDHLMTFMQKMSEVNTEGELSIRLDARYMACSEAKRLFREGELDAVLLPEPCVADLPETESLLIERVDLRLIVPKGNAFYIRESLGMEELRGCRFVGWDPKETPLLQKAFEQVLIDGGVEPNMVGYATKMGDMVIQVIQNDALGLGSTISYRNEMEGIHFVPVLNTPKHFGLCFVWHRDDVAMRVRFPKKFENRLIHKMKL